MDTTRKATSAEVRRHFKERGDRVVISRISGKVYFKPESSAVWLDGRYVDEYRARIHRGKCINVSIR